MAKAEETDAAVAKAAPAEAVDSNESTVDRALRMIEERKTSTAQHSEVLSQLTAEMKSMRKDLDDLSKAVGESREKHGKTSPPRQ